MRKHIQIEFDLLRSRAIQLDGFAEFPCGDIEGCAAFLDSTQDFRRPVIRIILSRRNVYGRDGDSFEISAQRP